MTEPSSPGRRRRSRSRRLARLTPGRGTLTGLAVIAAIVIVVAGVTISLGGGVPSDSPTTRSPSAVPSLSDYPLVPTPGPGDSFPPSSASAVPTAPPIQGIVARRIQIRRLGIDLKIVEGDGLDAPIGKAAHYPGSGWPDGNTNIYIYGHARTGMFLPLWDARVGDKIVLILADSTQRTYLVDEILPKVPWDAVQYLKPTPTEQLTLQTSTSYYDTAPRFVVIAHPAP
jgi:LPXTG-site transpeptidase (sortase) family protein